MLERRALVFASKNDTFVLSQCLAETGFPETQAVSCPPLRLCRTLDRTHVGYRIALHSTPRRLKIQGP
jgi:hypothetical protein